MRLKKAFIVTFVVTFLLGFGAVLPVRKISVSEKPKSVNLESQYVYDFSQNFPKPEEASDFEPEIVIDTDPEKGESKFNIDLLEVGDGHRKEDVKAKSGEIWLGFYKGKNNFFLRSEKIKVYPTTEPDYIEDSKTVDVNGKNKPIVLIKNAKRLRDGEVKTVFSRLPFERDHDYKKDDSWLTRRFVKEFNLDERKYTLRVKQAVSKENDKYLALVLESENKSQIIEYCFYNEEDAVKSNYEEYLGNLIWAGDLDRDGKLDLYLEYNTHEKGYVTILFLSTAAEKEQLLEAAAVYSPTGC